jgi:alkanesulfonate monooxygenase SsuD/methylene tetrahydromethanopterin reductase-like flavin-dependent oxidoreductase (luciferase family)
LEIGLALQNHRAGASREGILASADAAARYGWRSLWAVDHLVVTTSESADYGWTLEPLLSLAWIGATYPQLRLATGVLVPPMRDAVQLAKELATLDVLSGGRLTIGVGVGDEEDLGEYANLGKADRFRLRGAYLDEAIALWRHLWAGRRDPFVGRFNTLTDFTFDPLPVQGAGIPILSGGRSDRALARVGRLTDGLYSSRWGPDDLATHWPAILETAHENGRVRPFLATRVRVRFDARPDARYSVRGSAAEMIGELVRFAEIGVDEFVAVLDAVLPADIERATGRFEDEVVGPFREAWGTRSE